MEPQILVRRARASDIDDILAIERDGFGKWAWDRNLFAEYARVCGDFFLVAESAGKVSGYSITCVSRGLVRRRAELVSIAVAPDARGKGVADALLIRTLRGLRRRGIPRVGLTVKVTNERARAFYEKHGFRKVRRIAGYYEDGEDAFALRLEL
jgi:[ribosomal protein S18]-alanine N-acetyltransferase